MLNCIKRTFALIIMFVVGREPGVSEDEKKAMMAYYFKKQEELKALAEVGVLCVCGRAKICFSADYVSLNTCAYTFTISCPFLGLVPLFRRT